MSEAADPDPFDEARPLVASPVRMRGTWIFAGLMALASVGLFTALESRRQSAATDGTIPHQVSDDGTITAPPDLALPPDYTAGSDDQRPMLGDLRGLDANGGGQFIPASPKVPGGRIQVLPGVPTAPRVAGAGYYPPPSLIVPPAPSLQTTKTPAPAPPVAADGDRVVATRFARPELTVPQGAIIPVVLETALDSNRAGFARAIVSTDVRSFDGSRVLIQRGSRLFGEYQSDVALGQNRIGISWQRLTRPDGAQIVLDSPAADPLGRAGAKGKVNSHFFSRFGATLLQSSLNLGVGLATRSATNGTLIVGLPGSVSSVQVPGQEPVKPTIKVRQGTSLSVFVARDLDFSTVEQ